MDNLGVHLRHFYLGSRVTGAVWPLLTAPYKNTYLLTYLLTVHCYGERDIPMASCLSACLSLCLSARLAVTLKYRDRIGCNSSEIILWLVSLGCYLSAECRPRPQHHWSTAKGH